jgi:hypothetical protein
LIASHKGIKVMIGRPSNNLMYFPSTQRNIKGIRKAAILVRTVGEITAKTGR